MFPHGTTHFPRPSNSTRFWCPSITSHFAEVDKAPELDRSHNDFDGEKDSEGLHLESIDDVDALAGHAGTSWLWEEIDYRRTLQLFWRGALICFLAAFSSFTDGYQVS